MTSSSSSLQPQPSSGPTLADLQNAYRTMINAQNIYHNLTNKASVRTINEFQPWLKQEVLRSLKERRVVAAE